MQRESFKPSAVAGMELLEPRVLLSGDPPGALKPPSAPAAAELLNCSAAVFVENQGQWADSSLRYAFDGANSVAPAGEQASSALFNSFIGDQSSWRSNAPGNQVLSSYEAAIPGGVNGDGNVGAGNLGVLAAPLVGTAEPATAGSDAAVAWSTSIGGSVLEHGRAVCTDASGNILVAGTTSSSGWTSGGYDTSYNGGDDGFVAKFSPTGQLIWSTYLGGSKDDSANAIAVDASGNILVAGTTYSNGWTQGGYDTTFGGGLNNSDGFVAKLDPSGGFLWSTYLGGIYTDAAYGVAVDDSGNVVVTGQTMDFIPDKWVSGGYDTKTNTQGTYDAFVVKLSPAGEHLWSTYVGGDDSECGYGVAVDSGGDILATGMTTSTGWTNGGYDTTFNGGYSDAFLVKISPTGQHVWSTYLGGAKDDVAYGVAVDGSDSILVTGDTLSAGWTAGGFDTSFNSTTSDRQDAFVAKVSPSGGHLWSTYVGGADEDHGYGVAVDDLGNVLVTGDTRSAGWVSGGFQTTLTGTSDGYVAKLSPAGSAIWSSYMGGPSAAAIAAAPGGSILVTGTSYLGDATVTKIIDPIPGDANGDGKVSVGDLGIITAWYGKYLPDDGIPEEQWPEHGDFNGDGWVSVGDLGILAANYGLGDGILPDAAAPTVQGAEDESAPVSSSGAPTGAAPAELPEPTALPSGQGFDFPDEVAPQYEVGEAPQSMVAADVDGDGNVDLITANHTDNTVSVLRNLGDGTFAGQVTYAVGTYPTSVGAGDFDGDGDADLVTANYGDGTVSVLENLGDGTFAPQVTYAAGALAQSVATTDLDGDGKIDLAVANEAAQTVSVLRNLGDGTFGPRVTYTVGTYAIFVAAADLDGDGSLDLITTNGLHSGKVSVLRNLGDGTFAPQVAYTVGAAPQAVVAADVDGDGKVDLITANKGSGDISVLKNLSGGTFAAQVAYQVRPNSGSGPYSVAAADLDGDGKMDLATANYLGDTVTVLRNLGDGTFGAQINYVPGVSPRAVVAADLDGDGKVDLATANTYAGASAPVGTVSVLRNHGDGSFVAQVVYPVDGRAESVVAADLDADGNLDLATANGYMATTVSVLRNLGDGAIAPQVTYAVGDSPRSLAAADVDGDGDVDLIAANTASGTVSVLRNLGNGTFAPEAAYDVGGGPWSIAVADLDGDGTVDLATANYASDAVSILWNLGNGTFAAPVSLGVGTDPCAVTAADLEADGDVDLVTANYGDNTVSVLRSLGAGTFDTQVTYAVGNDPVSVAVADLDGDGNEDLVTANQSDDTVSVLWNLGNGSFSPQVTFAVGDRPSSVAAADVDADGRLDLVVASGSVSGSVSVLRSLGNRTFAPQVTYAVGDSPTSVVAADINNDGKLDLVIAARGSRAVSMLPNLVPALPGDANGDGKVTVGDLDLLAANYGTTGGATWQMGDFSGDRAVSVGDLGILAAHYGEGEVTNLAAPAPAAEVASDEAPMVNGSDDPSVAATVAAEETPAADQSAGLVDALGLLELAVLLTV